MNLADLDRDPSLVYRNAAIGDQARLVFRSNVREPVIIMLDESGVIVSEEPHVVTLADGWELAEPLESTAIVRDESYQDEPESPIVGP